MKIAYVITGLGLGGAEKQLIDLSTRVQAHGHQVIIISLTAEAKVLPPPSANIPVYCIQTSKSIFSIFSILSQLKKYLYAFQPDIIHSHMYHANILVRLYKLFFARHSIIISTAHSANEGGKIRMFLYRITHRLANLSTNVSQEATNKFLALKAFYPSNVKTIYNGIDTERFRYDAGYRVAIRKELGLTEKDIVLLNVGRLTAAKDQQNLIQAFKKLHHNPSTAQLTLLIAGEGELRDTLQHEIDHHHLSESIRLLGARHDIPQLMSAADLFVLSSAWEGLPLVLAEAMACNLLVVATNADGVAELVTTPQFLVDTHNPEQLAQAIKLALQLELSEKEAIRTNAKTRILEHFEISKVVSMWLREYQSLLKN